jgi:flagellar protein FlbD
VRGTSSPPAIQEGVGLVDKSHRVRKMIQLTRINRKPLVLNSDLIEHVEVTPDTMISMMTGQKFMVLESADEVIQKVIAFRKAICGSPLPCSSITYTGIARISRDNADKEGDQGATED